MLAKRAAPAPGGTSMESDFTTVFLYFVKEFVLPDWTPMFPTESGSEEKNAADIALVAYAKENTLPLITNEGYTPVPPNEQGRANSHEFQRCLCQFCRSVTPNPIAERTKV